MSKLTYFHIFMVIIGIILLKYVQYTIHPSKVNADLSNPNFIILVLSSRNNFDKREAIRQTWAKSLQKFKNIEYKFVIGNRCAIHLLDRLDKFSCHEANMNKALDLSNTKNFEGNLMCNAASSDSLSSHLLENQHPCYTSFGFEVVHSLTLSSIGILWKLVKEFSDVRVIFKDQEEVFETVLVEEESCSMIQNGYCFFSLKHHYILPKNFEGEISLSIMEYKDSLYKGCVWSVGDDRVRFTFGRVGVLHETYDPGTCSHLVANFSLTDVNALTSHMSERTLRRDEWAERERETELKIKAEEIQHGDVVRLPNVDVYRNLPAKVQGMLKWVHKNRKGSCVLKVDDDTYLTTGLLPSLLSLCLTQDEEEEGLSLWSHFHHHRAVPLFGKWADPEFQGLTYPSFPSGSGYLMSRSLVSLLSEVSSHLREYEGEDVSIGIWTEVLQRKGEKVRKWEVQCWMPSSSCVESVIIPELSPEEMRMKMDPKMEEEKGKMEKENELREREENGLKREEDLKNGLKREEDLKNGLKREKDLKNGLKREEDLKNSLEREEDLKNGLKREEDLKNGLKKEEDLKNVLKREEDLKNVEKRGRKKG